MLSTFDLQALDQQFEFSVLGDGKVDLKIPLNSAPDLRTWRLVVDSKSEKGAVGGVALNNLTVKAFLDDGQLVFDEATATLVETPNSKVGVKVKWPLPNRAAESISKVGSVEVSGNSLSPKTALSFFDRQMRNAGVTYQAKPQIDSLVDSSIGGALNFRSSLVLPAGDSRPVNSWKVDAKLFDSEVFMSGVTMDQIDTEISIRDGLLTLDALKGKIDNGGTIDVDGQLQLSSGKLGNVQLTASRFPVAWLAKVVIDADETGRFADRTGINAKNVSEKLTGVFDAQIEIDPDNAANYLWASTSDEIVVFGNEFEEISASGHYDGQLDIEKIVARLPGGGMARLEGDWIAGVDQGKFSLKWKDAAVVPLLSSQIQLPESFESKSDGELEVAFVDGQPQFSGEFDLIEPKVFGGTFADHRFEISTAGNRIHFSDIPDRKSRTISLGGSFEMIRPFAFELKGQSDSMPLSTGIFDKLSGSATANFQMSGQASPWKVTSKGTAGFENLKYDKSELSRIRSKWNFDSEEPEQQELEIIGLGGNAVFDSKRSQTNSLVFQIKDVDLSELAAFRKLPVELSGTVEGTAKIENWSDPSNQTVSLIGLSDLVRVGNGRLTRVTGNAQFANGGKDLEYSFESQFLEGKLSAEGKSKLKSISDPFSNTFPLTFRLSNGRVSRLVEAVSPSPVEMLRQLEGRVSAAMQWEVTPGEYPKGNGSVAFEDIKYRNRRVSRKIESGVSLAGGVVQLKGIRAELQQGEISGKATIPLIGSASGTYALDVRNFSLERMLHVLLEDPMEADGVVNARIAGRSGRTITGRGTLGVSQAGLFGVSSESMKIPVRYSIDPGQRKVQVEMPNARIKAFRGTIDGSAKLEFGSRTRLESKLELSNIDSQRMVRALTGYQKTGTGKLSGTLEMKSRNFRTEKDLDGSFRGELKQSNAFSFPVFDQIARLMGNATTLRSDQFDSDLIELTMSKGVVNVRQFRLQSALASVIVTGQAWLNGKLDLEVAARIERLNQPTLIEQLAGSPIARIAGPEAAFFAQAAEFLSERIVFVDVSGTAKRPQMRLNPGKQLKEEAIRYFLRGSQILPNANGRNN